MTHIPLCTLSHVFVQHFRKSNVPPWNRTTCSQNRAHLTRNRAALARNCTGPYSPTSFLHYMKKAQTDRRMLSLCACHFRSPFFTGGFRCIHNVVCGYHQPAHDIRKMWFFNPSFCKCLEHALKPRITARRGNFKRLMSVWQHRASDFLGIKGWTTKKLGQEQALFPR